MISPEIDEPRTDEPARGEESIFVDDPGEDFIVKLDEDKLEALVETLYLAAFADGEFSEQERAHFGRSVEYLTRGRLVGARCDELLARAKQHFESHGRDRCIDAVKRRLVAPNERLVALVLATDMVAADGVLHPAERELVLAMAAAFDISQRQALDMLDGLDPPPSSS